MLGIQVPGEEQEDGVPLWRGALPFMGLPHTIVVNRKGRRFSNEAFYRSVYYGLEVIDATTQTHPNYPCWLVLDQQARDKYPLGSVMPGQPVPDALGVSADSLQALAQKIGIDAQGLAATVQRFNAYSETGKDEEFDRGSFLWGALMVGDASGKSIPGAMLMSFTFARRIRPIYRSVRKDVEEGASRARLRERLPAGAARNLFAGALSLMPGPLTVVVERRGTIVSPWPPRTIAWMSFTETSAASARKAR